MAAVPDERHLRERLRRAGDMVARQAKINAAAFSRRIPAATHVRGADAPGDTYVDILTDGDLAPNAAPFEYAEHHPLFGSPHGRNAGTRSRYDNPRDWYRQPHRPYMTSALYAKAEEGTEEIAKVVDDWGHDLGFK